MKSPFTAIDAVLIKTLEKGTHWFQRHFSKTNFWLAKWFATIDAFVMFWLLLLPSTDKPTPITVFCLITVWLVTAFLFANYYWKIEEKKALMRRSKNEANPRKIAFFPTMMRLFFLTLSIFTALPLLPWVFQIILTSPSIWVSFVLGTTFALLVIFIPPTLFFYLIACDPLPPSEEKVREQKSLPQVVRASS